MFEYVAFESSDAGAFTRALNQKSQDGWEIESSGMVPRGDYGFTIWWVIMKRTSPLGD